MQSTSKPYRIDIEKEEEWLNYLTEHGYVAVGNAVTQDDCKAALQGMKESLAEFSSKLKLDDDETWSKHENYPFNESGGMIQYIGHAKFQWDLREKVAKVFAKVWDCKIEDLATSFDGFCYMDGRRVYKPRELLNNVHTDQSPQTNKLWSYQGLLNLCENGEDDGGFVVVPDSHKYHQEFMIKIGYEDYPLNYFQFESFDKKDPIFQGGFKVCAEPGDLILWDSRTFHGNTVPTSTNIRACAYICQIPKSHVNEKTRKFRKQAFEYKRCSTHHPGDGFDLFSEYPAIATDQIKAALKKVPISFEDMTDIQKSLLCIDE